MEEGTLKFLLFLVVAFHFFLSWYIKENSYLCTLINNIALYIYAYYIYSRK